MFFFYFRYDAVTVQRQNSCLRQSYDKHQCILSCRISLLPCFSFLAPPCPILTRANRKPKTVNILTENARVFVDYCSETCIRYFRFLSYEFSRGVIVPEPAGGSFHKFSLKLSWIGGFGSNKGCSYAATRPCPRLI